jgi:hypothetical protein
MAIHRIPVPDSLPPYDGDHSAGARKSGGRARRPARRQDLPESEGPAVVPRAVPGPDGWPSQFAQVLAETLAGSRPGRQLTPWTTEQTRDRIRELGPTMATSLRPRVRRVMTSVPAANVLELTAVVGFGTRVRVLALRLERAADYGPNWQCTALESA